MPDASELSLPSSAVSLDERLCAIRRRADAATLGPWRHVERVHEVNDLGRQEFGADWQYAKNDHQVETAWEHPQLHGPIELPWQTSSPFRVQVHSHTYYPADAEFIAHARDDIPYLLDLVTSLQATVASVQSHPVEQPVPLSNGPEVSGISQ